MVAVVDAAADGQRLGEHALPHHVAGHLVLDAGPDLVAVQHADSGPRCLLFGQVQVNRPASPGRANQRCGGWALFCGPMSGAQSYFQIDRSAATHLVLRIEVAQRRPGAPSPGRTAGRPGSRRRTGAWGASVRSTCWMKYSPLKSRSTRVLLPASKILRQRGGELLVAHFAGHLLAGPQARQVERADHRVGAVEVDVVGVVLLALDQAVGVAVLRGSGTPGPCGSRGQCRLRKSPSADIWCSR